MPGRLVFTELIGLKNLRFQDSRENHHGWVSTHRVSQSAGQVTTGENPLTSCLTFGVHRSARLAPALLPELRLETLALVAKTPGSERHLPGASRGCDFLRVSPHYARLLVFAQALSCLRSVNALPL